MEFVEKGAGVEADVLANLTAALPPELKDALPEELKSALGRSGAPAASAPTAYAAPMVEYAPMPAATLVTNQIGGCPFFGQTHAWCDTCDKPNWWVPVRSHLMRHVMAQRGVTKLALQSICLIPYPSLAALLEKCVHAPSTHC